MNINISVGKKTTTLRWNHENEKISLKFPGRVDAAYSSSLAAIIAVSTDGVARILKPDGETINEFSFEQSENSKFYLLERNSSADLGVSIVIAHTPELEGERFWQHNIDFENKQIGSAFAKWR